MPRARVAILGGGVAGVTLAKELIESDSFEVEILEKEGQLGGLQKSVTIDGLCYDIGSFIFHPGHELLTTFPMLCDLFVPISHVSLAINPPGDIDAYPMTLGGYVRSNGIFHTMLAALDLLACKLLHRKQDTLRSFIHYYLGSTVYRRSGLKSYIERFYCTEDVNVDLEFARQRLMPLRNDCSLRKNFGRIIASLNEAPVDRAWNCYARPAEGFGLVYEVIREYLASRGVAVTLNCDIERIVRTSEGYEVICADGVRKYDEVISTVPVPVASRYMGIPAEEGFDAMSLVSLFYRFSGDPGFDGGFLYNFTYDGDWKRLTLFSNYYGTRNGEHYFVVECTRRFVDAGSIEQQRRNFEGHIASTGMFRGELKFQGGLITPDAYPFYRRGDMERVRRAKERLQETGIHCAGRQGTFSYLTSHATAATSKRVAAEVIGVGGGAHA